MPSDQSTEADPCPCDDPNCRQKADFEAQMSQDNTALADVECGGFSIVQDGLMVAGGSGPYEMVKREAAHYAAVYGQDGPVKVRVWRNPKRKVRP